MSSLYWVTGDRLLALYDVFTSLPLLITDVTLNDVVHDMALDDGTLADELDFTSLYDKDEGTVALLDESLDGITIGLNVDDTLNPDEDKGGDDE